MGEFRVHEAPLVVARLPPRIGKLHVRAVERSGREHPRQEQLRIALVNLEVAELPPGRTPADRLAVAPPRLDENQLDLRMQPRVIERESAPARADLHLDRPRPPLWIDFARFRAAVEHCCE